MHWFKFRGCGQKRNLRCCIWISFPFHANGNILGSRLFSAHGSSKVSKESEHVRFKITPLSYASLLNHCCNTEALPEGKLVHSHILHYGNKNDLRFLQNLLMLMYGKCGAVWDARYVFDIIYNRNIYSWNILLAAYGHRGMLHDAWELFVEIPDKNLVSWNSMIAAYAQHGDSKKALQLFQQMQLHGLSHNSVTLISVLDASADQVALGIARWVHVQIIGTDSESDVILATALVNAYGNCACLDEALEVFMRILKPNIVSWTAIISGHVQNGYDKEALELFRIMQHENVMPNNVAFATILDACSVQTSMTKGKWIHACIINRGLEAEVIVASSLIDFYGKFKCIDNACSIFDNVFEQNVVLWTAMVVAFAECGKLESSRAMFERMPERNEISWNAIIGAYSQHGHGKDVFHLFHEMQVDGRIPYEVTFVSILSACSHAGLVNEGCHFFVSMSQDYNITPVVEHYNSIIDLLGRAAYVEVAENLIKIMPFQPTQTSWMTLLSVCRVASADTTEDASGSRN